MLCSSSMHFGMCVVLSSLMVDFVACSMHGLCNQPVVKSRMRSGS